MHLTPHKTAHGDGGESIRFPLMECWSPVTKTAIFVAEVNKARVSCRVSLKVLLVRFGACADDPMRTVHEKRAALRAAARARIERDEFEPDGSILLRDIDFVQESAR